MTSSRTARPHAADARKSIRLPDAGSQLDRVSGELLAELVLAIQQLSMARHSSDVQDVVKRAARRLARADGATVVLRDGELCRYVDEDAISPLWKGRQFPLDDCISGWAMRHRRAVAIRDVYADERVPHDAYRPTFVRSMLMTPIRTLDPLGAIGVYWATTHDVTDDERAVLQALADTTAVAVESAQVYERLEERVAERTVQLATLNAELGEANARLLAEIAERRRAEEAVRALSLTDDLTGLQNRRGFTLLAEHALGAEPRTGERALLVFVDVDGLKAVNDTLGHAQGDALIRAAADLLRRCFRETDIVARVGGDEFAVYVPHSSEHPDAVVARIEAEVARLARAGESSVPLSLSIGVTEAVERTDLDELLARADRRMYRHKRHKRRRPAREAVG